jgi:hypothetical protein
MTNMFGWRAFFRMTNMFGWPALLRMTTEEGVGATLVVASLRWRPRIWSLD